MAFIDWEPGLSTGIAAIDEQHQRLIGIINKLYESMKSGKSRELIGKVLNELASYTDYHFSTEERAFDSYGYERTAEHKAQHATIIKEVASLISKHQRNELSVSMETLDLLMKWITEHIKQQDMAYVPFLKGKDV